MSARRRRTTSPPGVGGVKPRPTETPIVRESSHSSNASSPSSPSLTRGDLLILHENLCLQARDIMARKNRDYAGQQADSDPFANFRRCQALGLCSPEVGLLVRLVDKLCRLITFAQSGRLSVEDETVYDTIIDMINYPVLLEGLMRDNKIRKTGEK